MTTNNRRSRRVRSAGEVRADSADAEEPQGDAEPDGAPASERAGGLGSRSHRSPLDESKRTSIVLSGRMRRAMAYAEIELNLTKSGLIEEAVESYLKGKGFIISDAGYLSPPS